MKELKIEIPEGYQIDEDKSSFTNIVFKPIPTYQVEKKLPTQWDNLNDPIKGFDMDCPSYLRTLSTHNSSSRRLWPTSELVNAALALCQLVRYRDSWNATETNGSGQWGILYSRHLLLNTRELRDKFQETFKDLIEQAKPLL